MKRVLLALLVIILSHTVVWHIESKDCLEYSRGCEL